MWIMRPERERLEVEEEKDWCGAMVSWEEGLVEEVLKNSGSSMSISMSRCGIELFGGVTNGSPHKKLGWGAPWNECAMSEVGMSQGFMEAALLVSKLPFIRGVWRGVLGIGRLCMCASAQGSLMKPLMKTASVLVKPAAMPSGIDAVKGGEMGALLPVGRGRLDDLAGPICAREICDGATVSGCCALGLP